ncbi:hypothetical protein KIOSHI_225 [Bacillus phage Kioshi]|nr:hypothetical protein KIOSHI_225 [Bacillus phage Kioshi]
MKINLPKEVIKRNYNVGDIIVPGYSSGAAYFIFKNPATHEYSLLKQDMSTFYTGRFSSLHALMNHLENKGDGFKHYPRDEYDLNLVLKEKEKEEGVE